MCSSFIKAKQVPSTRRGRQGARAMDASEVKRMQNRGRTRQDSRRGGVERHPQDILYSGLYPQSQLQSQMKTGTLGK